MAKASNRVMVNRVSNRINLLERVLQLGRMPRLYLGKLTWATCFRSLNPAMKGCLTWSKMSLSTW